jgi:phage virion morphogenesis protein
MSVAQSIRVEGEEPLSRELASLLGGIEHRRPLMQGIGLYLESSTVDRFDDQVAPDGSRWTPSLRARQSGGKTLTDHGLLKGSIGSVATNDRVEWGSNLIYARPHQEGATITAKGGGRLKFGLPGGLGFRSPLAVTLPARPFLGVNGEDETQIIGLAEDYVAGLAPGLTS